MLLYWSSQMLLPGRPSLEARLNASPAGVAPFAPGARPETHCLHTLYWLRAAGLEETYAATFAGSVFAPLEPGVREALVDLLAMRWGGAQPDVSPQDWQEYLRLCSTASADFILNEAVYTAFFTYSLFAGRVPARKG